MIELKTGSLKNSQKITVADKAALLSEWNSIQTEKPLLQQKAVAAHLTDSPVYIDYLSAYNSLERFLFVSPAVFEDMNAISWVNPEEYRSVWRTYFDTKQGLELVAIVPSDCTIYDQVLTAADNANGTVKITVTFKVGTGTFAPTHFFLFYKTDITAPLPINTTDFYEAVRYSAGTDTYTITKDLPIQSGTSVLHYRFALSTVIVRGAQFVYSPQGFVDNPDWRDCTYAAGQVFTDLNYWNYATGEMRHGDSNRYFHAKPDTELIDIGGYKLPASALEGLEQIIADLNQKIEDVLLKSIKIGVLEYFFDNNFNEKYLLADGRAFSPDVYGDFYEYWLSVPLGDQKSPAYCGRDKLLGWPKMPNLMGLFVRGVDERGVLDGVSIAGAKQGDAMRLLRERLGNISLYGYHSGNPETSLLSSYTATTDGQMGAYNNYRTNGFITFNNAAATPTAARNRPANISMYPFIRVRY